MDNNTTMEPFKMDGGKIVEVKVTHDGMVEIIEINPTPFHELSSIAGRLQECMNLQKEVEIAKSRNDIATKELVAATNNYESTKQKLDSLQTTYTEAKKSLKVVQSNTVQPVRQPEQAVITAPKQATTVPANIHDEIKARVDHIRSNLKPGVKPEVNIQKPEPKPESAQIIRIGQDVSGLIKPGEHREPEPVSRIIITAPEPKPEPVTRIISIAPEPAHEPVSRIEAHIDQTKIVPPQTPTTPGEWVDSLYKPVLNELIRSKETQIDQNDLIIEVTSRGVPKTMVTKVAEGILLKLKADKVISTPESSIKSLFGGWRKKSK